MAARRRSILALGLLTSGLSATYSAIGSETVTYAYDARGQLVRVSRSGTVNNGVAACYAYDKADNRANVNVTTTGACAAPSVPSFSVSDVSATEGGSIIFTVTKSGSTSSSITINYATANGTATAGSDYASNSGTLTFVAADSSETVSVTTTNDADIERAETVYLNLSNVSAGGVIVDGQGIGTVVDNEGFSVSDAAIVEGVGQLRFTITKTGSSTNSITLGYATADGTANAGSDYSPKSGSLTFSPTSMSQDVNLTTVSDTAIEPNETFLLNIFNPSLGALVDGQGVATINDNDSPPSFSVSDVTATEGGEMIFTVTKTGLTSGSYSVNYATSTGTATSGSDFPAISGTMTFAANETAMTRTITATEDVLVEGTEQFTFNLSAATGGATISDAVGVGTINDNDTAASNASFSINDVSTTEGGLLVFTVTKAGSTTSNSTVNYATSNGSAQSGDYTAQSGTLTFTSTQTSQQISVQTTNNLKQEPTETIQVTLSGAAGASISDSLGIGTIYDDDDNCVTCRQSDQSAPESDSGGEPNAT